MQRPADLSRGSLAIEPIGFLQRVAIDRHHGVEPVFVQRDADQRLRDELARGDAPGPQGFLHLGDRRLHDRERRFRGCCETRRRHPEDAKRPKDLTLRSSVTLSEAKGLRMRSYGILRSFASLRMTGRDIGADFRNSPFRPLLRDDGNAGGDEEGDREDVLHGGFAFYRAAFFGSGARDSGARIRSEAAFIVR